MFSLSYLKFIDYHLYLYNYILFKDNDLKLILSASTPPRVADALTINSLYIMQMN